MRKWTITRETSKYNKYMKWHLVGIAENGSVYSDWFKTEREAVAKKEYFESGANNKYTLNNRI